MSGEWVAGKGEEIFREFFPGDWDALGNGVFQGVCPGAHLHSKNASAKTDCRIYCGYGPGGETPGAYCFHGKCSGVLADLNSRFRERLFEKSTKRREQKSQETGVAQAPRGEKKPVNELYDEEQLRAHVDGVETVDEKWFMARSPVDPRGVMPGEFLNAIFEPGERALVFTNFYSQGEFAWVVGHGGRRLSDDPAVKSVPSALPLDGGKDGVWFLSNPVTMAWEKNPRNGKVSRRSKESVSSWKYLVLESDDAPEELWLKFLAIFGDPIRAIYSSGGRSWHALVAVYRDSWAEMDGLLKGNPKGRSLGERLGAKAYWARFGADPGALTPVRLTRLPGCSRNGKEQKLIYLNPHPLAKVPVGESMQWKAIVDLKPRREIK
jgi:hypothetical protein